MLRGLKVSVVIPVYNVDKFLAECLDSVLGQTFADIEVVCVNDGATDRSPDILRGYAEKDARVRVIDQPNGGPSAARNTGVRQARGEYLLFVDGDDTVHPRICEKLLEAGDRTGADMTYFFLDCTSKRHCDLVTRTVTHDPVFTPGNLSFKDNLAFISFNSSPCVRLWRTRYFRRHDLWFPVGLTLEDIAVGWLCLLYAPKVALVPERLYDYRIHPSSVSHDAGCGRDIAGIFRFIKTALVRDGLYGGLWKELFLHKKLSAMLWRYELLPPQFREASLREILASIGDDEREYLRRSKTLSLRVRDFYRAQDGGAPAVVARNAFWRAMRRAELFFRN